MKDTASILHSHTGFPDWIPTLEYHTKHECLQLWPLNTITLSTDRLAPLLHAKLLRPPVHIDPSSTPAATLPVDIVKKLVELPATASVASSPRATKCDLLATHGVENAVARDLHALVAQILELRSGLFPVAVVR